MEHRRGAGRRRKGGGHRAKRRYGRIVVLACSLVLTLAAAGAATGFVPYSDRDEAPSAAAAADPPAEETEVMDAPTVTTGDAPVAEDPGVDSQAGDQTVPSHRVEHGDPTRAPAGSGKGRRVVYDISDQRVWLVGADNRVRRSYLVSGSVLKNLRPGSYKVYSRSRHAVSFDQRSTMEFMVRFTEGRNAPIGFHDIPKAPNGKPLQTVAQLGTAQSHGCIRQRPVDARAMWRFADIGTPVKVVA